MAEKNINTLSVPQADGAQEECRFCTDPMETEGQCSEQLWPDGDITPADQKDYRMVLVKIKAKCYHKVLNNELHLVSSHNFVHRLEIVLDVLDTDKHSLHTMLNDHKCTALHSALKLDNTGAALLLIQSGDKQLVMTPIMSKEYEGTTALHQAVVNSNREVVKAMLDILDPAERMALIHARATGNFFCHDVYMSSLPLSLGIWCTNRDILCDLIGYGANLDSREPSLGDTVLHTIVRSGVHNSSGALEMLYTILDCEESKLWWCQRRRISTIYFCEAEKSKFRRYIFKMKNSQGYTPLILAAKLGIPDLVTAVLDLEGVYKVTNWKFGKRCQASYEMNEIDGIVTERDEESVLDLLADTDDRALSAFSYPLLRSLSSAKWDHTWFVFLAWFIYHFLIMVVFTSVAVHSPLKHQDALSFLENTTSISLYNTTGDYVRLSGELLVASTAIVYGLTEVLFMIRSFLYLIYTWGSRQAKGNKAYGIKDSLSVIKPDAFRIILRIFSVSVLVWCVQRIRRDVREDIPMAIGLITGWYFILFFTRAVEVSAFFTVMIHRMLFGDLLRFMFTFSALLVGFGTANMVLYKGAENGMPYQLRSFDATLITMFRLLTGLSDIHLLGEARCPLSATVLYVSFVCVATILLLNMLIAAMSDTYANVSQRKELFFLKYRLVSMIYLENNLPFVYRTNYMVSKYMRFDKHNRRWEHSVKK